MRGYNAFHILNSTMCYSQDLQQFPAVSRFLLPRLDFCQLEFRPFLLHQELNQPGMKIDMNSNHIMTIWARSRWFTLNAGRYMS